MTAPLKGEWIEAVERCEAKNENRPEVTALPLGSSCGVKLLAAVRVIPPGEIFLPQLRWQWLTLVAEGEGWENLRSDLPALL
jgi:hypothetical protein